MFWQFLRGRFGGVRVDDLAGAVRAASAHWFPLPAATSSRDDDATRIIRFGREAPEIATLHAWLAAGKPHGAVAATTTATTAPAPFDGATVTLTHPLVASDCGADRELSVVVDVAESVPVAVFLVGVEVAVPAAAHHAMICRRRHEGRSSAKDRMLLRTLVSLAVVAGMGVVVSVVSSS